MTTPTQPPAAGEAAHTPTPWHLSHQLADGFSIAHEVAPSCGLLVCVATVHNTGGQPFHGLPLNDATAKANAAFIVRACNGYAALVEAAEWSLKVMDAIKRREPGMSMEDWLRRHCPTTGHAEQRARAALALAKGGAR